MDDIILCNQCDVVKFMQPAFHDRWRDVHNCPHQDYTKALSWRILKKRWRADSPPV
jgi:hypothetical protein